MTSAETSTLAGEAYTVVRRRIMRGELALGGSVSRRKLAAELGMSFLPVSEALVRLESEGLLESRPRAGTRVPIPSLEDVEGQYAVREALEAHAALLFVKEATSADITRLRRLASRLDRLNAREQRALYVDLHHEFHYQIAQGARCRALVDAVERSHALASVWFCAMSSPKGGDGTSRHVQLAEVLATRDAERAVDAVRQHIAFGKAHALRVLAPYFEVRKSRADRFSRASAPSLPDAPA